MDKLWIVFLFIGVFLLINNFAKRFFIGLINSDKCESSVFVPEDDENDPKVFWEEKGFRREPQQADFELPEEDFFENEKTEFSEEFEGEFSGLSEKEINKIHRFITGGFYLNLGELVVLKLQPIAHIPTKGKQGNGNLGNNTSVLILDKGIVTADINNGTQHEIAPLTNKISKYSIFRFGKTDCIFTQCYRTHQEYHVLCKVTYGTDTFCILCSFAWFGRYMAILLFYRFAVFVLR